MRVNQTFIISHVATAAAVRIAVIDVIRLNDTAAARSFPLEVLTQTKTAAGIQIKVRVRCEPVRRMQFGTTHNEGTKASASTDREGEYTITEMALPHRRIKDRNRPDIEGNILSLDECSAWLFLINNPKFLRFSINERFFAFTSSHCNAAHNELIR